MNLCWEMPCCKCGGSAWYNCCKTNCCCPGMKAPSGPEWEAAKEGLKPFLDEAVPVVFDKGKACGGCCLDVFAAKKALDGDWTGRANAYLATHGLALEVCAFYTSDGKSSHPHLVLQFRKAPLSQS